jgi:hypothetical protein
MRVTKSDISSPVHLAVDFCYLEVDLSSQTTRQQKVFKISANQKDHARTKPLCLQFPSNLNSVDEKSIF